jgi:hypothetical protein
MKTEIEIEIDSIKSTQKYIDNEIAQQSIQSNKEMLKKLSERALNRAFQLDRART